MCAKELVENQISDIAPFNHKELEPEAYLGLPSEIPAEHSERDSPQYSEIPFVSAPKLAKSSATLDQPRTNARKYGQPYTVGRFIS